MHWLSKLFHRISAWGASKLWPVLSKIILKLDCIIKVHMLFNKRWENQPYLSWSIWNMGEIFIIFGLKMMVKSGLKNYFWNSSMRKPFSCFSCNSFYFIGRWPFLQNYKFSNKMTLFAHGGVPKKIFVGYADMINETSLIIHFDWVRYGWICHLLCANRICKLIK